MILPEWPLVQDGRVTDETLEGIAFPAGEDGRRSTTALGRAVLSDALRPVDPVGSRAASQETGWRSAYVAHFRRAVEAGLGSRADALAVAAAGVASVHDRMRVVSEGQERPLGDWPESGRALDALEITGTVRAETH